MTIQHQHLGIILFILLITTQASVAEVGASCNTDANCVSIAEVCSSSTCICSPAYEAILSTCVLKCPEPPPIENGSGETVHNEVTTTLEAVYTCSEGYVIEDINRITCDATGNWVGPNPACIDPCIENPCPAIDSVQNACTANVSSNGYVCICPDDFKGDDCTIPYNPIVCDSIKKHIHFETNPNEPNRTKCISKTGTNETFPCYGVEGETIKYSFDPTGYNISVDDRSAAFCVTYLAASDIPELCINITAHEYNDFNYRPWLNTTLELCFIFNKVPRIEDIPPEDLRFNVVDMPPTVTVPLTADPPEVSQTVTWSNLRVFPDDDRSQFITLDGESLIIQNPKLTITDLTHDIYNSPTIVEVTATDDGVPVLDNARNFTVVYKYLDFACTSNKELYLLHLVPVPDSIMELGNISCTLNENPANDITFNITSESGPVIVTSDGFIQYDHTVVNNQGTFSIIVEGALTEGNFHVTSDVSFTVLADDLQPTCTATDNTAKFGEKDVVATCSDVLYTCTDLGGLAKTCNDQSDRFYVSCSPTEANDVQVRLCVETSIDSSGDASEEVTITVSNEYADSLDVTITVTTENVNDPPVLVTDISAINLTVPENTSVGNDGLLTIAVDDPDMLLDPPADSLSATLTDLEPVTGSVLPFDVNVSAFGNAVSLILTETLDGSKRSAYILNLEVVDTDGLSDSVTVNVAVEDVNEAPVCDPTSITAHATVRDVVGHTLATLACSDNDYTPPFNILTYSIQESASAAYFQIDDIGVLTLSTSLQDVTDDSLTITIDVVDGGDLKTTVTVNVNVTSSYPPVCDSDQVSESVSEKLTSDACFPVDIPCEDDVDPTGQLQYIVNSGNASEHFILVDPAVITNQELSVCPSSDLQGLVGRYAFIGVVRSQYGDTDLQINIDVEDVNDPPNCTDPDIVYTVAVTEDKGYEITTLNCVDSDTTPQFRTLTYTITDDAAGYFAVHGNGVVYLEQRLTDITTTTSLSFNVDVSDTGGLSVNVPMEVTVNATFPPVCALDEVSRTKSENTNANECFVVDNVCEDIVTGESLSYNVWNGNGTSLFNINDNESNNTALYVCTTNSLQGYYGSWQLNVGVTSSYGQTNVSVIISVTDQNEAPTFTAAPYSVDVPEDMALSSSIYTLSATDPDSGAFGQFSFNAVDTEFNDTFTLDSATGEITLVSSLNAEESTIMEYTIEVKDEGQLSSTTTFTVNILDVNDEEPICTPASTPITVELLLEVGSVVFTAECTDADISDEFSQIVYSTTSTLFDVMDNGTVILSSTLPRDKTSHEIRLLATDADKDTFVTEIVINVMVNTNVPPVCDATSTSITLNELETVGKCVDNEVKCEDPTGAQVTFESQQGNASTSDLFEIRIHTNTGSLGLSACIKNSLKDKFYTYELIGVISNGLGTSTVRWTITIENVNEAPIFTNGPYTKDLLESTPISQSPVLVITVTDPDNGKGNIDFELPVQSIIATATNDDDYDLNTAEAFLFLPSTASFYVIKKFNATVRDVYTFTVTATDNGGLSSSTQVTINITDVNSAPMCDPWSIQANTDILADLDTVVVSVFCYDTDILPEYTNLSYKMSNTDPYFDVNPNGQVFVANKLPRALLHNTGHATFDVLVSDGGIPALSASVNVDITVDNKIPTECDPVITPPDVWVQYSCANITMYCTDPSLDGTDHMSFNTFGNYTQGFELQNNIANGVLILCYQKIYSDVFEISITVSNGLQDATFTELIVVGYSEATPVFNQAKYSVTINEKTEAGDTVLSVSATSSNLVGQLKYTVIETPSLTEWNEYLTLDGETGAISTLQPVKTLANTVITLKVEAEDTGSKLKSSAQVEITVEDVNEAPSCGITSTNINNVDVNVDVGTKLILFNCSDPDVKTEYKTLSFSLSGESVNTYFTLVGEPPNSIAVKRQLSISTKSYSINLTVQDGGTTPLAVNRIFEVTVSILPPPVQVVVMSKTNISILIEFKYLRTDFYDVTEYFKVKAIALNGTLVHESAPLGSMAQTYNITGLDAETPYNVVVEATTTDAGTRESGSLVVITRVAPVFTYITFICVVPNITFNGKLRDDESQLYYSNRQNIANNLKIVLQNDKGFARIERMTFRPWNSIAVDTVIALNQSADPQATLNTLEQTVKSGWLHSLYVNSGYFIGSVGAGFIAINEITQSPPSEIFNGSAVRLECKIETIGYLATETFTIWWTYQGNIIKPTEQSRYHINTTTETFLYENKLSVLQIDPVLTTNTGEYGCHVLDTAQQEKEQLYYVNVIGQPIVVMEPMSQMVQYGATVRVSCMLVMSPGVFDEFVWFRNGNTYVQTSNEELSESGKYSNMTIRDITKTVTFACQGVNQAGAGAPAMTTISVIPQDITDEEMCQEETLRGITWAKSAPKSIIRLTCGTGYTGKRYRKCGDGGIWAPPFYDCVRDQLQVIEEQVKELKDGASSTTLDAVIDKLVAETNNTELFEGDLETSLNVLDDIVAITSTNDKDEIRSETKNILQIASNMIDEIQLDNWVSKIKTRQEGAIDIPGIVERYLDKKLDNLLDNNEESYTVKNIYVQVGAIKQTTYNFPERSKEIPTWVDTSGTSLKIPGDAFRDLPTVHYASSFYKDISSILVKKLKDNGNVEDITDKYDINADIISFQVNEQLGRLDTSAEITFKHYSSNYSKPICAYWDFIESTFITDGIKLVSTNDEYTVCESDHFTNFALLMSPGKTPEADLMALSIISAVGCGISILCLVLTIILYLLVWRYVKSDRAVLLLNLCVALIISYIIFLAGIDRAENETICTVISALLHYFYLVVFFLMLAYGIEIAICVVYVFVTRSRLKWLLPLAWGIPLLIVGISLGATQLEGYGNDRFCWLSTEDGVLWAFVGPAALIIVINFVIVVIVLRQMFKSSAMMTKSDKEKAVTGVRSICVLLPILGLTWVFGIFSVNESLVVFQYIFAICNTLQGFLIFLFHCVLNNQLKQALKQRNEKRKSLASIENTFKNPQSTGSSAAFYSTDSKSTQLKNNVDSDTNETSNPFLQADRQMKELVAKNKTGGNVNEVNNKLDKDLKHKPVDLDDVKISNILRESEVMGGTAGISSILQEQPRDEHSSLNDTKASSHRYDYVDPYGMNRVTHDTSAHGSGSAKHSNHSDRSRERRQRETEREREEERLKQIEYEKRDRQERERKEREKRERENIERDRERQERERKDREKRDKEKHKNKNVITIGYGSDTYLGAEGRSRDHSHERRGPQRPHGPSRADDDYEKEAKKQADSLQKKKEKNKSSLKERSAPYEYSYDSTYLGGSSRHASLENMNMQHYGYSPYAQMPGMGGYQTGRPTHQQQHWDQYRYPRDPRDPYGRDYY